MSHLSHDTTRGDPQNAVLHNSNQTSGYFLGTVQREWMREDRHVGTVIETPNVNATRKNSSISLVQGRATDGGIDQSQELSETHVNNSATSKRQLSLAANYIARSSNSTTDIDQPTDHMAQQGSAVLDPAVITLSPQYASAVAANNSFSAVSATSVTPIVTPQRHAIHQADVVGTSISHGTVQGGVLGPVRPHQVAQTSFPANQNPYRSANDVQIAPSIPPLSVPPTSTGTMVEHPSVNSFDLPSLNAHSLTPAPSPNIPCNTSNVHQFSSNSSPTQPGPNISSRPDLLADLDRRLFVFSTQKLSLAEIGRINCIKTACHLGDVMFIMVHQFITINQIRPLFLPSTPLFEKNHLSGLKLLEQIFASSTLMRPDLLLLLANFVTPLELITKDAWIRSWLPRIRQFLVTVVSCWAMMCSTTIQRGYPPSAFELYNFLGIWDHSLLQAMYTRLCYERFPRADSAFLQNAISLFKGSQDVLARCIKEGGVGMAWKALQDYEIQHFAREFRKLIDVTIPSISDHQGPVNTGNQGVGNDVSPALLVVPQASTSQFPVVHTFRVSLPQASPQAATSTSASQVLQQQQNANRGTQAQEKTRLLPEPGYRLPINANPNPSRCALHQAHLASPALAQSSNPLLDSSQVRYYSFLHEILGKPEFINSATVYESWVVSISPQMFMHRVTVSPASKDDPLSQPTQALHNGAYMFHLRCVKIIDPEGKFDQDAHSVSAIVWPEHLFVSINGIHLEFRRKIHHGRNLPVDVTSLIRETNNLELSYHYFSKAEGDNRFAVTLESIQVFDHVKALELPCTIDIKTSLSAIIQSQHNRIQDDDLVMTGEHISIDLIDPFTARIFDVPVRGRTCRHRECFDLEAFLQSRNCRGKDGLVHSDEWKCPICGLDTRPTSLVIDEFMIQVKKDLIVNGKGDTKAILVKSDGSWEAKPADAIQPNDGSHQISREPPDNTTGQRQESSSARIEPVFIDLIDDD